MSIYDFGAGGYDIEYHLSSLSSLSYIDVCSKIGITVADANLLGEAESTIRFTKVSATYWFQALNKAGTIIESYPTLLTNVGMIRIVFHNEFCTVYVDDLWVHTFCFMKVYHPEDPEVSMRCSGSLTVSNILLRELADWREAIYIDLETTSQNAISSVVLQRPMSIYPRYNGSLVFCYDPLSRETITLPFIREHRISYRDVSQACSDGIVQSVWTTVVIDEEFAKDAGFVTRIISLPDLDTGYIRAAHVIQKVARQQRRMHVTAGRVSPTLEIDDIARASYTTSGTSTVVLKDFIVEDISISIKSGECLAKVQGRENTA